MSGRRSGDGPTLSSEYSFLRDLLAETGATGLVVVGDRFDDDLRYLTRFGGPDRDYAFVYADGTAVLCAPALFDDQARREFPGDQVRTRGQGDPAGVRAAATLSDLAGPDGRVLVPAGTPHDAALRLEDAGYELESTTAVTDARVRKTPAELARLRRVQDAATSGMQRAETVLAEATVRNDQLYWEGDPLTTERLRRAVNAALASAGVRPADNTVIGAGETAADLHFTGSDTIEPDETVLLDLSPRGPDGYYGDLTRTFTVESEGGWARRAYVAVEAAREAALTEVTPGVPSGQVHREAAAELAAYGFRTDSSTIGFTHSVGHGVGLSLHEAPSLSGDVPLEAGHVVTIEPGVYDPSHGGVRLEDLIVVTEDGYELLATYPFGLSPSRA